MYKDAKAALQAIKDVEPSLQDASSQQKALWSILAIRTAKISNSHHLLPYYAKQAELLFNNNNKNEQLWQQLLLLDTAKDQRTDYILEQLQKLESKVTQQKDKLLLAYYHLFLRRAYEMNGEEFMIVLCNKTPEQITALFEKIRAEINNCDINSLGIKNHISASIGITKITEEQTGKTLTEYLIDADTALYYAKNNGRNQIQEFGALN